MALIKPLLYLTVVLAAPLLVQCISVVGPRILRPHGAYTVAIAGTSRAYTLYVAVEGRRANGEQYSQGREVQVPAGQSRLIDLDIGDPGPGQYTLVGRSTSGPQFSSSAPLRYQARSFCVFVQTDKRVYQPGDTVNFRVVALNKYLLPLSTTVDVSVLDTGGSPVQQWAGVELDVGVLTQQLVLADEPALGEWTIQVEVLGQKYSRQILVADYVQPRFQMNINMPKEILFSDGKFDINVTAKHFNGLPVHGELTISAFPVFFSGVLQPVVAAPTRKVVDINGQTQVTFDLKTDLDLVEDAARPLVVEAVIEEKDTLIRQNVSSRILLLRTPYRLKVSAPSYFKPTLPYIVQVEVVDSAGQVLPTDDDVTVERLWDDGAPLNTTTIKLEKGRANYVVVPDAAHVNSTLNLVIKYKDVSERVVNIQRSEYSSGQFLTVEILSRDTAVGGKLRARVSATEPMDLVHYALLGRGDIVSVKTVELSPASRSVEITADVTSRMSPGGALLAWFPRRDATNVLAAAVYAPQANLLQNDIAINPISGNNKPNSVLEVKVSGSSGALVALLAADSAAVSTGLADNALGSGLDLHIVEREIESFNGLAHSVFKNEEHLPAMGLDLGGYSAYSVFENAGVVILTDGVLVKNEGTSTSSPIEAGTRPPLAGPYAFSRLPAPPSPRFYLTAASQPTWMLANLTVGLDGTGAKEKWTAATSGEYTIGAFSVHPTLGLGLASPQKFTTSVPLSITSELPATLQKGETIAAVIILKTSLAVDTSVEVTFYNSDQYFEFEPLDNELNSSKKIELFRRVRVTIPARGSVSTAFLVTAVRTGDAPVIVEASGNGVSDSLFRTIQVQDGYEEEVSSWGILDARNGVARSNVTLEVVRGARVGPVWLGAAGSLLAGALQAARRAPAPAPDPPHALRPFALACVLLDYLQSTGPEEVTTIKEIRSLAAMGFQRLMAFRRKDGSFTTQTDSDHVGDVWSTAVSSRWLSRCSHYVQVEDLAARTAASWLAKEQLPSGAWPAPAAQDVLDPHAQQTLSLTAYALIALNQAKGSELLYKNNINKAVDFIAKNLSPDLDAYTLALIAGAFGATRHPQLPEVLQMMDKYANTSGSTLYWSRPTSPAEWRNPWLKRNSLEASTAAWGLRALLAGRLPDRAAPVAAYILQACSYTDPDPELVDALAQYAQMTKTAPKLRISVNASGSDDVKQFQIDDSNALIIQTKPVRSSKSVSGMTEGRGLAVLGLSARCSTNVTAPWPRYTLDPRVDQVSTKHRLQLSICFGFVVQANETASGLTLLTVQLPSGYLADINTLTELTSSRHVLWSHLASGGARVLAAVRATRAERCVTLGAARALPVARQRAAWVTVEDLYDSSHRGRVFYQVAGASACDVCRAWASCARACGSVQSQVSGGAGGAGARGAPDAANTQLASLGVLVGLMLLHLLA